MGLLGTLAVKIVGDNADFTAAMKKATADADAFAKKMAKLGKQLNTAGKNMTKFVSLPLAGIAAFAIKSSAEVETLTISFESLLGSSEAAAEAVEDLIDFTAKTPFQLAGVGQSAKQLLAAGVETDQLQSKLKVLGDISAGAGIPLTDMASIFGKIKAKGKAMTEEILQMSDRGIPIIQTLADHFGVAKEKIFEMASKGEISFEAITGAMEKMTGKGGIYFDQMGKQSRSLSGIWSTLIDTITIGAGALGDSIVETFNLKEGMTALIEKIQGVVTWFKDLTPGMRKFIVITGALVAAIGPLLIALGFLMTTVLPGLITAFAGLNVIMTANPIGAIVVGVAALIAGMVLLYRNIDTVVAWIKNLWTEGSALTKVLIIVTAALLAPITAIVALVYGIKQLVENWISVKYYTGVAVDYIIITVMKLAKIMIEAVKIMFAPWILAINGIIKAYNFFTDKTIPTIGKLTDAVKNGIDERIKIRKKEMAEREKQYKKEKRLLAAQKRADKNRTKDTKKNSDERKETYKAETESVISEVDKINSFFLVFLESIDASTKGLYDKMSEAGKAFFDGLKGNMDKMQENIQNVTKPLSFVLDSVSQLMGGITDAIDAGLDIQRQKMDQAHDNQLRDVEKTYANETKITDAKYKKDVADIEVLYRNRVITEEEKNKQLNALTESYNHIQQVNEKRKTEYITQLEEEHEKKSRKVKRKQAIATKITGIFQSIINTALGVSNALGAMPPPASFVMAAITGVLGAITTATIAAQPIPALARGGLATGRTLAQIGEGIDDEAILPLNNEIYSRIAEGISDKFAKFVSVKNSAMTRLDTINRTSQNKKERNVTVNINAGVIVGDKAGFTALERKLRPVRIDESIRLGFAT